GPTSRQPAWPPSAARRTVVARFPAGHAGRGAATPAGRAEGPEHGAVRASGDTTPPPAGPTRLFLPVPRPVTEPGREGRPAPHFPLASSFSGKCKVKVAFR